MGKSLHSTFKENVALRERKAPIIGSRIAAIGLIRNWLKWCLNQKHSQENYPATEKRDDPALLGRDARVQRGGSD